MTATATEMPKNAETNNQTHHHHHNNQQEEHYHGKIHFKEYKFFRSFSAKVENWPMRKAEALWRRMREKKIAGKIS